MILETLDSLTWSMNFIFTLLQRLLSGEIHVFAFGVVLLGITWVCNYKQSRPPFRQNAGAAVVCGLISVTNAMLSLQSKHFSTCMSCSIVFGLSLLTNNNLIPTLDVIYPAICVIISALVSWIFNDSTITVLLSVFFASLVMTILMKYASGSFTIGEYIIVSTLSCLPIRVIIEEDGISQISSMFIIAGVLSLILSLLTRIPFVVFVAFMPFYLVFRNLSYLISFVFSPTHIALLVYCGATCIAFVLASVFWKGLSKFPQIIQRKFFHIMALLVFVPPALLDIEWLRLAISGAIYAFLVVESLRLVRFPVIHKIIEKYVSDYIDDRDNGELILTHLFLLLGCGIPVLLCNLNGYVGVAVRICGISVLAIGDAAASAIGVKFGKHKWPNSKKSIEGTIGAFFGTWICILLVTLSGTLDMDMRKSLLLAIPSLIGALDEAFTSQIDNLTLPFAIIPSITLFLSFVK